jgi:hypothetical protein
MKKNQDTINQLQEETKALHVQLKDLLQVRCTGEWQGLGQQTSDLRK